MEILLFSALSAGVLLGIAADKISFFETNRGYIAFLLLTGFGLAYTVWSIKNWERRQTHNMDKAKIVSYWTLFALIVFGPCEQLIFAGCTYGWFAIMPVFAIFGIAAIGMMIVQVHAAVYGLSIFRSHALEHASDVIAGGVIALTGIPLLVFGI